MITKSFAQKFAQEWLTAWNSHNLDAILAHYTADFEMNSPLIVQRMGIASGRLQGQENIRAYWQIGLERNPQLHFELKDLLWGVHSLTIYYIGSTGGTVAETFHFNEEGLVERAFANYSG